MREWPSDGPTPPLRSIEINFFLARKKKESTTKVDIMEAEPELSAPVGDKEFECLTGQRFPDHLIPRLKCFRSFLFS